MKFKKLKEELENQEKVMLQVDGKLHSIETVYKRDNGIIVIRCTSDTFWQEDPNNKLIVADPIKNKGSKMVDRAETLKEYCKREINFHKLIKKIYNMKFVDTRGKIDTKTLHLRLVKTIELIELLYEMIREERKK